MLNLKRKAVLKFVETVFPKLIIKDFFFDLLTVSDDDWIKIMDSTQCLDDESGSSTDVSATLIQAFAHCYHKTNRCKSMNILQQLPVVGSRNTIKVSIFFYIMQTDYF